jgi:hypothetical protein
LAPRATNRSISCSVASTSTVVFAGQAEQEVDVRHEAVLDAQRHGALDRRGIVAARARSQHAVAARLTADDQRLVADPALQQAQARRR